MENRDTTEIQKIIRDYYRQQCANKMDRLEEMEKKCLEMYNLPIPDQKKFLKCEQTYYQ